MTLFVGNCRPYPRPETLSKASFRVSDYYGVTEGHTFIALLDLNAAFQATAIKKYDQTYTCQMDCWRQHFVQMAINTSAEAKEPAQDPEVHLGQPCWF